MSDPVLVEVTRGGLVESRHRGAVAVVDAAGKVIASVGDIEQAVFPRSAVKAIQALPLVESGAADRYGFGLAELALASSSHNAEPRHVATAEKMLAAAGTSAADLECGPQVPSNEAAAAALFRSGDRPGPIHNNCSGKHAGFICFACHAGISPQGYVEPDHPVQQAVTAALSEVTGTVLDARNRGIDGCSIPTYAIPLRNLARGFARFVTGEGLPKERAAAARRLVEASQAEPWMIGGTGRYVTEILERFGARVFAKDGAEGVFCGAFRELGLGVAIKCDDGAGRAADVILGAAIEAFVAPDAGLSTRPVRNRRGRTVGEVRAVPSLLQMLKESRRVS
jgi:L-asparaginase II